MAGWQNKPLTIDEYVDMVRNNPQLAVWSLDRIPLYDAQGCRLVIEESVRKEVEGKLIVNFKREDK